MKKKKKKNERNIVLKKVSKNEVNFFFKFKILFTVYHSYVHIFVPMLLKSVSEWINRVFHFAPTPTSKHFIL